MWRSASTMSVYRACSAIRRRPDFKSDGFEGNPRWVRIRAVGTWFSSGGREVLGGVFCEVEGNVGRALADSVDRRERFPRAPGVVGRGLGGTGNHGPEDQCRSPRAAVEVGLCRPHPRLAGAAPAR